YEEYLGAGLEDKVKQADCALLETLQSRGVPAGNVVLRDVSTEKSGREEFHYQLLEIPLPGDIPGFAVALSDNLRRRVPDAVLRSEPGGGWRIDIAGVHTHQLLLRAPSAPSATAALPPALPPLPGGPGRLAIVIDDLGENVAIAKALAGLPVPVTFAIWPFADHRDEVRSIAREHGLEYLVHMPMEPVSYPDNDPGPDALFAAMPPERIIALMDENLARVPGAAGVNNHMGSRFTAEYGPMLAALGELKDRGLFFLDSRTIGGSKAPEAAAALGVPFHSRDIFLDNVARVDAIVLQLRKAERIALTRGHAIAIGHGYPETVRAIRQWAAGKSKGLSVVSVAALPRQ
ncbi:MAG: divergent polysaccharide deacetylase family protein, partial [Desulfovibrionaceae bacterium]